MLLFISIISTYELHSQKDKDQPTSKRNSLVQRLKRNTLKRSKSSFEQSKPSRQVTVNIEELEEKTPAPLIRVHSNSFSNNVLARSRSFKKPQEVPQQTRLIDLIPVTERFSTLREYMELRPSLMLKIVHKLEPCSADIYTKDKDHTNLLHLAARYNQIIIAYYLIRKGLDINSQTITGQTALDIATECKHNEFVEFVKLNNTTFKYK